MNICVYGAGAIGSLFASYLSKHHKVSCIARTPHVKAVNNYGLMVTGKTEFQGKIPFYESIFDLSDTPYLVLLTVKAFDTKKAAEDIFQIITKDTLILSIQNGLGNIEKLTSVIPSSQVLAGITSHGSLFLQSGIIKHTGIGKTRIGELDGVLSKRLRSLQELFIRSGITVDISTNIKKEIWKKAIVNASINPLTTIFQCKNGYLLENPILTNLLEKICIESTLISTACGFDLNYQDMIEYTYEVINDTKLNSSSMLQSILQKKKTELDEINGMILDEGKKRNCDVSLNEMITHIIPMMYRL